MDWGAGHLTIIVGTGAVALADKNCPQGWAFEFFFKCRGMPGGGCSRLELTHTLLSPGLLLFPVVIRSVIANSI